MKRDQAAVEQALDDLRNAALDGGNIMEASIALAVYRRNHR